MTQRSSTEASTSTRTQPSVETFLPGCVVPCLYLVPGGYNIIAGGANRFISPGPRVSWRASGHPGGAKCCRITRTLREEVSALYKPIELIQIRKVNRIRIIHIAHILSRFLLTNMKTGVFYFVKLYTSTARAQQLPKCWIWACFMGLKHLFQITHIWLGSQQTASFGKKIEGYFATDLLFPQNQV